MLLTTAIMISIMFLFCHNDWYISSFAFSEILQIFSKDSFKEFGSLSSSMSLLSENTSCEGS